jgi:hypothetical protein
MTCPEQGNTRKLCSLAVKCLEVMPTTLSCSLVDHQIRKSKNGMITFFDYRNRESAPFYSL